MKKRSCYLFIFEGFADWEPALVTAGLNNYSDFEIKTFSVNGEPVRSMGNLKVVPDLKFGQFSPADYDLIILPGGNLWEEGGNTEISSLILDSFKQGKTIAAICAATTFLASLGLYSGVRHTSNGLEYLRKLVPSYTGEDKYVNESCVSDKNVITANGSAMIEFAYAIFLHFEIMNKDQLAWWFNLNKSGGMTY